MAKGGATTWYFPDGYLPEKTGPGLLEAHEALMLLNTSGEAVTARLTFYFEDRPPVKHIEVSIEAERIRTLRLDMPEHIGGLVIAPLTQYSIRVQADKPIVAQFGRLDTSQANLSYY